jgi:hypothetical protein
MTKYLISLVHYMITASGNLFNIATYFHNYTLDCINMQVSASYCCKLFVDFYSFLFVCCWNVIKQLHLYRPSIFVIASSIAEFYNSRQIIMHTLIHLFSCPKPFCLLKTLFCNTVAYTPSLGANIGLWDHRDIFVHTHLCMCNSTCVRFISTFEPVDWFAWDLVWTFSTGFYPHHRKY